MLPIAWIRIGENSWIAKCAHDMNSWKYFPFDHPMINHNQSASQINIYDDMDWFMQTDLGVRSCI